MNALGHRLIEIIQEYQDSVRLNGCMLEQGDKVILKVIKELELEAHKLLEVQQAFIKLYEKGELTNDGGVVDDTRDHS